MIQILKSVFLLGVASSALAHIHSGNQIPFSDPRFTLNGIPFSTRAYWMRRANEALPNPCPFAAFGTVIVNHTGNPGLGELICTGSNNNSATGNPTLHGEISAINNCTTILTSPAGPYRLTPSQASAAFTSLTLYTNAESCPMCASAIRWAGFREYVYGTSIPTLIEKGWGQIRIVSAEVFQQSFELPNPSRLLGEVLTNETDPLFSWQFDPDFLCPAGCERLGGRCQSLP
ncbi:hypothetical protein E1B28_000358 [Marasmius oreades]|uniref:CMP/dCMP-type deaminase domain-containing protein n=1 Tax=Marasmius oreades TaxID=181124 RepID=A0A9P8AE98_9AGAR|nr:uncharacterized protein E1B28_000358 [Marasmius oreades]KAG7098399.1 hypothetical protein E1B28_000358 [Marasmius oreades]